MSEYEYRGHTITVDTMEHLDSNDSPRDWSNVGVMHCAHRRYELGDEQTDPSDMQVACPTCGDIGSELPGIGKVPVPIVGEVPERGFTSDHWAGWVECPACYGSGEVSNPVRWAVERNGATVVLGLYLYDHSGITMSASTLYRDGERVEGGNPFTCRWDSGMVGIAFDTPEGVKECMGDSATPELIEKCLHGEVQTYDDYLTGDVYYFKVEGPLCDDACYGYYLSHEGPHDERTDFIKREAEACIDADIAREASEREKIGRMMAL